MPQEIIYYLVAAAVIWVVIFAIDYWCSEYLSLKDVFIHFIAAICFPITLFVVLICIICESDEIYIKKPKKNKA